MTPSRVTCTVSDLGTRAGIRMTTHSLRRYFATTLYYSTDCDLQTVRRLMRHVDVSTTLKCYVDAYDVATLNVLERLTEHIDRVIGGNGMCYEAISCLWRCS